MLQRLAARLHLSYTLFYAIGLAVFLVLGAVLGFLASRLLHRLAKKLDHSWKQLAVSLLAPLPIPLLILAALYAGVKVAMLPAGTDRIVSRGISALAVLAFYYFPARVIAVLLWRLGQAHPVHERVLRFAAFATRALFVLLASYTILQMLELPAKWERAGSKVLFALTILLIFYGFGRTVTAYLGRLSQRDPALQRLTEPGAFVAQALFGLLAVIVVLENLGIHLAAVWTTLGVGSVAVALALQETLGNLFSGIYLLADRPINPGDYVKLDADHEGYVVHVGWRATTIRTLANNLIIVPNASLGKAVITNYSKPEERMSLGVQVSTGYGMDPRRVERVLLEAAREAIRDKVEGLLDTPEPSVSLIPGFGRSTLDFTLGVQVRSFVDQYPVQNELRSRILEGFRREKIEMAVPTQKLVFDVEPPPEPPGGPVSGPVRKAN